LEVTRSRLQYRTQPVSIRWSRVLESTFASHCGKRERVAALLGDNERCRRSCVQSGSARVESDPVFPLHCNGVSMRIMSFDVEPFHEMPYHPGPRIGRGATLLPFHRATVDAFPMGLEAIIAIGDLQGVVDGAGGSGTTRSLGEAVACEIRSLQSRGVLPDRQTRACCSTGDLHPHAGEADVTDVWRAFADVCRWVVGVAGNHDVFGGELTPGGVWRLPALPPMHLLDETIVQVDDLRIGGVSGIVGSSTGPWTRSESDYSRQCTLLRRRSPTSSCCMTGRMWRGPNLAGWPSVRRVLEAGSTKPCDSRARSLAERPLPPSRTGRRF